LVTISTLAANSTSRLTIGPHPDRACLDAEALLLHILGKDKAWLMVHSVEELPAPEANRLTELVERRFRGEPMQYITGEAEFYGLSFRVTPDVLIPRPETEHLVERVLDLAASFQAPRIVDIGTGSGAIAIALAHKLPDAVITAVDISVAALNIARLNAKLNGVDHRIRFLEGDLLRPVMEERFEFVVSNPPYVPLADRGSLAVEVRDHEPAIALFAGQDGLEVYRRIIPSAFRALIPGGFLAYEIGYGESSAITEILSASGFHQIELVPDLQKIPRVVSAQRHR
jgi:release factor glutamine methyltransferase